MKYEIAIMSLLLIFPRGVVGKKGISDIRDVVVDLKPPVMSQEEPAPGKRVRQTIEEYENTEVYHALYLPTDWEKGRLYPVIVEYAGNGPYRNDFGDVCSGKVEDCNLGYGISGGRGYMWITPPYISKDRSRNQLQWWGDLKATVEYCKRLVQRVCREYGGDPEAVFIAGFSRGAIACNYIGLHDDEIASLWRGFFCHSHYDGVRKWNYPGSDRSSAAERLARLRDRPQFISHEMSVEQTRNYLDELYPQGNFTFMALPYRNHTDSWVLRDIPERKQLREWFREVLKDKSNRLKP
ncbi:MAG: alpha/beta hydrolase family protein [Planctomycetota bacterium]|jgi:hypothetical protein